MHSDDDDESIFKLKKEYRIVIDKIYDKMNNISEVITIIKNMNDELKKNIKSIYEIMFNLSDDSQLTQVEINTINPKIDDALNFACNKIYRKNRISSKSINEDNLNLLKIMISITDDIISQIGSNYISVLYAFV